MHIGFDLDNTIAIYDVAIKKILRGLGGIPNSVPMRKTPLSNYLKSNGRNGEWTQLQGELYGPLMELAFIPEGWVRVVRDAELRGDRISIISHRSRTPYGSQSYDLHSYARSWITKNVLPLLKDENSIDVQLVESLSDKIDTIRSRSCDMFVDDLEVIINHLAFPKDCKGIVVQTSKTNSLIDKSMNWQEIRLFAHQLSYAIE